MGMPRMGHGLVMAAGRWPWLRTLGFALLLGGFNSTAGAKTLQAGALPDNFSVSAVGAAVYQIPVELPPGVHGLKPSLSLLYNSQQGSGQLGMGWSLTGLSVITRCPQTPAQDQNTHLPDLSLADRFCLDGSRLILISGSYGAAGSTYRTEIDSFQQVTAHGTAGNGPSYFTVVDRAGLTRTYSTQLMRSGGTTAMEWLLTSVTDKYNDYISFQYNTLQSLQGGVWQEIAEIDYGYGYSGVNTGTPVDRVIFGYGTSGDPYNQYFAHTYVGVNMALMTSIAIEDGGGAVLRQYRLTYNSLPDPSNTISINELTSVQECSAFSNATCFNPTTFSYNGAFTSFGGGNTLGDVTMGYLQVADLDGDGLPDYVYEINSQIYVTFGNQNGNSIFVVNGTTNNNAGIAMGSGVPIDLYGDGKQEMLVPFYPQPGSSNNQPYWKVLSWNGQTGSAANLRLTAFPVGPPSANDPAHSGTVDAVAVDPLNVGQQGLLFVSNRQLAYYPNVNGTLSSTPAPIGNIPALDVNAEPPPLTPVNFSGSGKAEVYVAGNGIAYWNSADGQFELEKAGNFDDANSKIVFVDNNGDGLTGVFEADQGNFWFWPNAGDGTGFRFQSSSTGAVYTCSIPAGYDTSQMLAVDWYHDGRQEVLIPVNGTWYLVAFNAQASNLCLVKSTGIALQTGQKNSQLLDVNGDGQFDMVYTNTASGATPTQYLLSGGEAFTLNQVTDGLGHNIDVGYSPLGREVYVTGMAPGGTGPEIQPYAGPLQVVKDFAVDTGTLDGSGNPQQVFTYYLYGGAAVDTWGRGFLGFAQVEAVNYNSNLYNTVTYEQAFPFTGLVDSETENANPVAAPKSTSLSPSKLHVTCTNLASGEPVCNISSPPAAPAAAWITGGTKLSVATNCYASNPNNCQGNINQVIQTYNGVYYPVAVSNTKNLYDLNTGDNFETVTTSTHYSKISNTANLGVDYMPDDVTVTKTDNTPSGQVNDDVGTVDTKTVYADDSSSAPEYAPNCPGHPEKLTVSDTLQNVTAQSRVENFTYDTNTCFLTSDTKTISDPAGIVANQTLTRTYTSDSYGNTVKEVVTGGGLASAGRTTTRTYDVTGRFPAYVTNALDQTEAMSYDTWGHKISDTDANGNTITYGYSVLGLLQTQSGPQSGVSSTLAYSGSCSIDCVPGTVPMTMDTTRTNSDGSVLMTQTDELNRSLRAIKTGFAGEYILQDTQYDMLGRVVMTTMPYKDSTTPDPSCEDTKTYDLLNRVTKEVQPYKLSSDGKTCVTRTIKTGYADFTVTKTITDNASNAKIPQEVTATTLNVLSKPLSATDSNSGVGGTTTYTYDPWGNLTMVTSPDGGVVKMGYDSYGDKLSMTDPDMGSWSYRYDALGELTSQTDANGNAVANTYDALGRLVERDEPEDHTFWKYDVAYGAGIGRLAYTYSTQPDGTLSSKNAWEGYAYDVYGEATDKITLVNGQEYWVTTTYDGLGRPSQLVYPDMNGINANSTPAIPAGLNAVVDPNDAAQIDVAWTLAKSGQIYHLYRTLSTASQPTAADEIYAGPTSAWADDTLTVDGSYTWWLNACNGDSNPGDQKTSCSGYAQVTLNNIVLPPTVPGVPTPPSEGLQMSTTWPVTWLASSLGVTTTPPPITYNLQYSYTTDGSSPTTTTTTITGVSVTNASESAVSTAFQGLDGQYVFRVQACAAQVCSMYSAWSGSYNLIIQPSPVIFVTTPSVVTPNTSPGPIPVSWDASAVSGAPVTYQVYVASGPYNGSVGSYALSGTVTSSAAPYTTVSYNDMEGHDAYYGYYVVACDSNNTSVCSAPAYLSGSDTALTLPPTPPGGVTGPTTDSNSTSWTVSWAASSPTGGPASNISVVYYLQESLNGTVINTYYTGNNSYTTSGHTKDGTYTYRVMGAATDSTIDNGNDMAKTSWVSSSYGYTTVIAPAIPTNITLPATTNIDGSFTATWTEPNTAGSATSYSGKLGEWDNEKHQYRWIDGNCNGPSATPSGTCYPNTNGPLYVMIMACNTDNAVENGVTACSNDSAFAGPITVNMPSAPTLSGGGGSGNGTRTLTWTTVTGVGHYMFYSATQSASTGAWSSYIGTNVGAATSKSVTLTSAQSAGHYYVEACDSVACTVASNTATVTYTAPAAPTLSGPSSATNGKISISWNAPAGASSYQLYRSVEKASGWQAYAQVTPSGRTYSDSVGALVQAVQYYVVACNFIGCGSPSATLVVANDLYVGGTGCPPPPYQCQLVMPDGEPRNGLWGVAPPQGSGEPLSTAAGQSTVPSVPALELAAVRPAMVVALERTAIVMPQAASVPMLPVALVSETAVRLQELSAPAVVLEQLAAVDPADPQLSLGTMSARRAFMLARPGLSSAPQGLTHEAHHQRPGDSLLAAAPLRLPVQAIDPRLSMYPPLRKDPRVLAHFEAMGGQLPADVREVNCVGTGTGSGDSDTGGNCSQPGSKALMVGFVYNSAGQLAEVDKLGTVNGSVVQAKAIWQGLDATAAGQIDLQAFDIAPTAPGSAMPTSTAGATFSISTTYDPVGGLMTATSGAAVTAGATVNATYTWDGFNNLLTRTLGETVASSQTQAPGLSETFTYDPLNRLTSTTTNSGPSENYGYQATDGELTSKGGYSNYRYDQTGSCNGATTPAHLHALASLTTPLGASRIFAYDANGNLICESGDVNRTVTWSSFNKPIHIQGDSATEDFTYGPGRERLVTTVNKQVNGSPDQVTTTYIDGVFESDYDSASGTYTYRHYVVAGGMRVAVETITANSSQQQTGDTLGFFVHDQVGSVIAEVAENEDSTNQQMAIMSYDPWGKARPSTGSDAWISLPAGTSMDPTFAGQYEGFGQHENLDDVGLVDMEGRVYDPEVGGFLSADPTVQFPFSSQGYDRYVYVDDNPLSFSDPSGYSLVGDILGAGAVVGAAGTIIGTSVGIATGVGGTAIGLGSTALGPAIGHSAESWIDSRLNPQEFSVINMISSYFCGPFYALCYGANTYNYERANGVPVDKATKAAAASGVEAEAGQIASDFAGDAFSYDDETRTWSLTEPGYLAAGAAVAYGGGYASATIDGGDGTLGGERALGMYAFNVAMDISEDSPITPTAAKYGAAVKQVGDGCVLVDHACMGTYITGPEVDQEIDTLPSYASGCTWTTECGSTFQWLSMHNGVFQGNAVFHDDFFKSWTGSDGFTSFVVGATAILWHIPTAAMFGGYAEYYLVRDPGQYH